MNGTTVERQKLIEAANTLPDEVVLELAHFLDYLRYKLAIGEAPSDRSATTATDVDLFSQLESEPDWSKKIDLCLDEETVKQTAIIRTERGLTVAGTRITIYDVMDYWTAGYPPKFIRAILSLTDTQLNAALAYIETHREQVEAEYQLVLREAEELRQHYEEKNRDLIARLAAKPPKPGMKAAWEKLQAQKARHRFPLKPQG